MREDFWKFIQFRLGSSSEIGFWEDRWVGEVLLKEPFMNLFSLAMESLVLVVDSFDGTKNIDPKGP